MKKYKLLGLMAKKRGGGLFWLGLLLLAAAAVDQFYIPFLGSPTLTLIGWGVGGLAIFVAILLRMLPSSSQSAHVEIEESGLIVNYGRHQLPITYENIDVITGGRISQHHSLNEFGRRDKQALKPYFNQTHVFIALHEETEELKEAQQKMPPFIFGTTQVGLILLFEEDWITVERAIDAARVEWLGQVKNTYQEDHRSAAAKLLDEYDDDDEHDDGWRA